MLNESGVNEPRPKNLDETKEIGKILEILKPCGRERHDVVANDGIWE